jgi:hypothetical protein
MKKILLIAGIASSLLFGSTLQADKASTIKSKIDTKKRHTAKETEVLQNHIRKEADRIRTASTDIQAAVQGTVDAVGLMMNGKSDDANTSLAEAVKLFDAALKSDPDIGLVAVENNLRVHELVASEEEIKSQIQLIQDLLQTQKIQAARAAIQPLRDEIVITTIYLPVKLYAKATREALESLNKENTEEAVGAIRTALNTLVTVELTIPVPLILAEDLVVQASGLDKSKKAEAGKLLDQARSQLRIAELLGYTDRHNEAYTTINRQIDDIQQEIKGENSVEKLYQMIKESFAKLEEKVRAEKIRIDDVLSGKADK